ncbi:MAG: Crp/Fnr family transcriptional regulator [Methylococcales bacterium]|nr:Crp/Fnr family transcriptional regulator [Methylococcales bacterium]
MDTIEILKGNDLFNELDEKELLAIAALTKIRKVAKNTFVINAGDSDSSMYIIKQGSVNVKVANEDGKEMILTTLKQGDQFGELSLLDAKPRSADIVSNEKCEFLIIQKEPFNKLLEENSKIAINVINFLCSKVRFVTFVAQGLALMDVYGRLVKLLHDLSETNEEGKLQVSIPLTHKDIALRVGSSREMISRILKELETGSYLMIKNKIITINKKLPLAW